MTFKKTMCDRLGYKYKYVFENVLYTIYHLPYAKEYIGEEALKQLEELNLKINTGEIEIIEFTRPVSVYKNLDVDEIVKENKKLKKTIEYAKRIEKDYKTKFDKAIDHLTNSINILKDSKPNDDVPVCWYSVRERYLKPVKDILSGSDKE